MFLISVYARWIWRRAAYRTAVGRYRDRNQPQAGRFTHDDIRRVLAAGRRIFDAMLPQERLERFQTLGNRLNVVMAAISLAHHRAFVEAGIEKEYATELISDTVWKAGQTLFKPVFVLIRRVIRDPRKQMNCFLQMAMRFPFDQPASGLGYRREFWTEPARFCMDLYQCAQYDYVKEYGEPADAEVFRKVWCMYDFAAAQAMTNGGRYERRHTLSAGDNVCDMRWYAGDRAEQDA